MRNRACAARKCKHVYLDFDVRMGTEDRGEQTRRRAVPVRVHGHQPRPIGSVTSRLPRRRPVGRVTVSSRRRAAAVRVAEQLDRPQRPNRPDGRVLDNDPRAPDHGQREHFQRVRGRYGNHVVARRG